MKKIPLFLAGCLLLTACWNATPAVNPDPNHTHADFAVWINGTKLDFSAPEYMSTVPTTTSVLPFIGRAHAHGDEPEEGLIPGREYLHLHDGNGHVIHRHKPGLTLGNFFASIGLSMTPGCMTLDDHQYEALDAGWKETYAVGKKLCSNGKFHWQMFVNGEQAIWNPEYVFADNDQILLTYDAGDDHTAQLQEMTDDACMYSRTCPERGDPPAENCIADPTVPCVVQ